MPGAMLNVANRKQPASASSAATPNRNTSNGKLPENNQRKDYQRTNVGARQSNSPAPKIQVTEQQRVKVEQELAKLYKNESSIRKSLEKRWFIDFKGKKSDEESLKKVQKQIKDKKKEWQGLWGQSYKPSTPEKLPGKEAVLRQIDKLQAVASHRVSRGLTEFDQTTLRRAEVRYQAYKKLHESLVEDQKKQGFMEKVFFGRSNREEVKEIKKTVELELKNLNKLREQRESLVKDYAKFVTNLDKGRSVVMAQPQLDKYSDNIKIEVKPVRSMINALGAVQVATYALKEHTEKSQLKHEILPAQKKSDITKNAADNFLEDYDKLNWLGKLYARNIKSEAKEARKTAEEYKEQLDSANKNKETLARDFNIFIGSIDDAIRAYTLDESQNLESIANPPSTEILARIGNINTTKRQVATKKTSISHDFSNNAIAKRLGLDPEILELGEFTRGNEGTPESERKIHWPGYNSGVTLAGGYDLGQKSLKVVKKDLEMAQRALKIAGKPTIPDHIVEKIEDSVGLKRQDAKRYLSKNPELKKYRLETEAVDVFFYQYFKRELNKAKTAVHNNTSGVNFDDFPWKVKQIITDTVTRGDFISLKKQEKSDNFYGSLTKGAKTGDWEDFLTIYAKKTVFQANPKIIRHDIRADFAEEMLESIEAGEELL